MDLDEAAQLAFFDRFIQQAVEDNGLVCGGQCGIAWDIFVALGRRGTATEEHRAKVQRWLQQHPQVSDLVVGPLVDAWHSVYEAATAHGIRAAMRSVASSPLFASSHDSVTAAVHRLDR